MFGIIIAPLQVCPLYNILLMITKPFSSRILSIHGVPLNASGAISILLLGNVTDFSFEQDENAPLFIVVTESGIVIVVRAVHSQKDRSLIVVKCSGRVIEVRAVQRPKV